ncbi:hypothetical protein [Falsirhodobacter sp. 20TX0035]|uniref:hypothetical protein n=1 Tax=Falsirhodobacter sp. 20TX0035 TaxID=3022019 RepID=UPI00232FA16C|nr:hypothetical protein [Falsirhodobacter sp. 20TX0035]MDB6454954.1 hypothetical protein [Falsirhodobacter sp. 20TX0035]
MTVGDIKDVCKVETSQIYQWKAEVIGKGAHSRPWRKSYQMFKEVTLLEERQEAVEDVAPTASFIRIQGRYTALCIPADYPVDALLAVLKVLEGDR